MRGFSHSLGPLLTLARTLSAGRVGPLGWASRAAPSAHVLRPRPVRCLGHLTGRGLLLDFYRDFPASQRLVSVWWGPRLHTRQRCHAACRASVLTDKPCRLIAGCRQSARPACSLPGVLSWMSADKEQTAHLQAGLCRRLSCRGPRYEPLSRAPFAARAGAHEVNRACLLPV